MMKWVLHRPHGRTPWWMVAMALVLGLGAIFDGYQYGFGPALYRTSTAQHILQVFGSWVWNIYGSWLIVAGVLILLPVTRAFGFCLAGLFWAYYAFTLWEASAFGSNGWFVVGFSHGNPPSIPINSTLLATFYFYACRRAIYGDPRDGQMVADDDPVSDDGKASA